MAATETKKVNILVQMSGDAESKIKGLGMTANESDQGFGNLTGSIFKAELALRALDFTIGLVKKGLGAIYDIAEEGANLDRLIKVNEVLYRNLNDKTLPSLESMRKELESANTYGANAENAIKTLLAGGLVPLAQQVERVNQQTGQTEKGFDAFILTLKDLAAAAGVSSGQGIDLVTRAINQMNPAFLESMGIQINLAQLWRENASTLENLSGEQLTAAQRQIFFNEIMKEGEKVVGAYDETYKTAGKNLLSIQDAWEGTRAIIGLALQPAFQYLTKTVLDLIKAFREIVQRHEPQIRAFAENLAKKFDEAKNTLAQFFETIQPYLEKFIKFMVDNKESVGTFIAVLLGLLAIAGVVAIITAIVSAFNPLVLVIAGVALGVTLLKKAWDENLGGVQEKARVVADFLKEKFEQIKTAVENVVNSEPVQKFIEIMKWLGEQILAAVRERIEKMREAFEKLAPKIKELWDKLEPVRKVIVELIKVWLIIQGVILAVAAIITGVLILALIKIGTIIFDIVIKAITAIIDGFIGFIDFINSIPGKVEDFIEDVKTKFEEFVTFLEGIWEGIIAGIEGFVQNVIGFFTSLIQGVHDQLNQIVTIDGEGLADFIQRNFNEALIKIQEWLASVGAKFEEWKQNIINVFNSIKEGIANAFTAAKDWISARIDEVKGFLSGLYNWAANIFNQMKDKAVSVFAQIVAPIKSAFQQVGDFINGIIDSIKNTLTNLWDSVKGAGNSIAGAFKQAVNALIDKVNGALVFSFNVLGKDIKIDLPDIPKLARGGEFETSGKQLIMVGDNASGKERIRVTPLEATNGRGFDSQNGQPGTIIININGYNKDKKELAEEIYDIHARRNRLAELNSES
jgi:phage-related protein